MNVQDLIVECIRQAAANVFSTMLGVELGEGAVSIEAAMPEPNDGVVSFIGLAGSLGRNGQRNLLAVFGMPDLFADAHDRQPVSQRRRS